jgi:hypothetical protein
VGTYSPSEAAPAGLAELAFTAKHSALVDELPCGVADPIIPLPFTWRRGPTGCFERLEGSLEFALRPRLQLERTALPVLSVRLEPYLASPSHQRYHGSMIRVMVARAAKSYSPKLPLVPFPRQNVVWLRADPPPEPALSPRPSLPLPSSSQPLCEMPAEVGEAGLVRHVGDCVGPWVDWCPQADVEVAQQHWDAPVWAIP